MEAPRHASPLYKALHATAVGFVTATAHDASVSTQTHSDLRTYVSPSFQHSFGHNYAVSVAPPLQGTRDFDGFTAHMASMTPRLQSAKNTVTEATVDEVQMQVVLRVKFLMLAKGAKEEDVVENDVLWVIGMEGSAEGGVKIVRSVEFVDGMAAGRLRELMMRE